MVHSSQCSSQNRGTSLYLTHKAGYQQTLCNGTGSTAMQDYPPGNTCGTDLVPCLRGRDKSTPATDYSGPTNHLVSQIFSFLGATGPGAVRRGGGIRSLRTEQQHLLAICGLSPTQQCEVQSRTGRKEDTVSPVYKQETGSGKLRVWPDAPHYPPLLSQNAHPTVFSFSLEFILFFTKKLKKMTDILLNPQNLVKYDTETITF